jgi:hypothetical protein
LLVGNAVLLLLLHGELLHLPVVLLHVRGMTREMLGSLLRIRRGVVCKRRLRLGHVC